MSWSLSHPYRGLFHDSGLYTLQALGYRAPDSLGQDVFLRFGSQDRYTIFSPLYAAMGRLLGTEQAAAALTFTFQIALFVGGWLAARAVMPARLALYGVAVLVAIPGDYGIDRIFTCVEPFLTPRMAAEALTLASLAAALSSRLRLAAALIVLAILMHPIMASAGIAVLLCLYIGIPNPRLAGKLLAVGALLCVGAAAAMPTGPWGRFDAAWLQLVMNRSPYLFLTNWRIDDWGRVAVTLATLTAGIGAVPSARGRALCKAVLWTTAGGLLLTFIACDELHLVLFTQLQPWRWQWLGSLTAALLLPQIGVALWRCGVSGRTTSLLLAAAWIFSSDVYALVGALAALGSIPLARRLSPNEARLVFWGACGMLCIAILWRLASNLEFTDAHYLSADLPGWRRRAMSFAHDGSAALAVITLSGWLAAARRRFALPLLGALAALAAVGCAALLPLTLKQWTARQYPPQRTALFASWRGRIPPGADVFWPESPLDAWLLLERPSYLSALQTSGMVFSRAAAMELQRRALALAPSLPPAVFLDWDGAELHLHLSLQQLQQACGLGAFEYLVTGADLGVAPAAAVAQDSPRGPKELRLYHCPLSRG